MTPPQPLAGPRPLPEPAPPVAALVFLGGAALATGLMVGSLIAEALFRRRIGRS